MLTCRLPARGAAGCASHILLLGVYISAPFQESDLVMHSKNFKNVPTLLTECIITLQGIYLKKIIRSTKEACYTKDDGCTVPKINKLGMSILFSRILNIHMLEYHCSFYSTNIGWLAGAENFIFNHLHPTISSENPRSSITHTTVFQAGKNRASKGGDMPMCQQGFLRLGRLRVISFMLSFFFSGTKTMNIYCLCN